MKIVQPRTEAGKSKRRAGTLDKDGSRSLVLGCRAALSASRIVASGATVYDYASLCTLNGQVARRPFRRCRHGRFRSRVSHVTSVPPRPPVQILAMMRRLDARILDKRMSASGESRLTNRSIRAGFKMNRASDFSISLRSRCGLE